MTRLGLVFALLFGTPLLAVAAPPDLQDIIVAADAEPGVARFRFIDPNLAPGFDFDLVSARLLQLCNDRALPELGKINAEIWQIIVSLSDRPVVFGVTDPDATQTFEVFEVVNNQCSWGAF